MAQKPRVRVMANDAKGASATPVGTTPKQFSQDSFQNFLAQTGIGTSNMQSGSTYGFNPISRNRQTLEWMYRGSWIVSKIVDCPAEDMTRAGIEFISDMPPDDQQHFSQYIRGLRIFDRLRDGIQWSRLYGGAICVMMIDGQDLSTPLNIQSVRKGQFKGLLTFDRWQLTPSLEDTVSDIGPRYGEPRFYTLTTQSSMDNNPQTRIHYSRVVRLIGASLPYWQAMSENSWGMSVLEPCFDRLTAFDSATQGAAQLVFRAHLRTYKVPQLRELIAAGGQAMQAFIEQMNMIRLYQSNEGMTLLDGEDEFETHQYSFGGLSDVLVQFGQQLSGSCGIPLVRLFGQSPSGMNATGESDFRNYYDNINSDQESRLRSPLTTVLQIAYRSFSGMDLPEGFDFKFVSLWQMTDAEKATIAQQKVGAITSPFQEGIIGRATALKELRQISDVTGMFTNITDEDITAAEEEPSPFELQQEQMEMQQEHLQNAGEAGKEGGKLLDEGAAANDDGGRPDNKTVVRRMAGLDNALLPLQTYAGLPLVIETHKGEKRGFSRTPMPCDYGYIRMTGSLEGPSEQMDCYVGPNKLSENVWILYQVDPDTRRLEEHKVMLGFNSEDEAVETYVNAMPLNGLMRVGDIKGPMSIAALRMWLRSWQRQEITNVSAPNQLDRGALLIGELEQPERRLNMPLVGSRPNS